MRKQIFTLVLLGLLCSVGNVWGATKTITINGPTAKTAATANVTYSSSTTITESVTITTGIAFGSGDYVMSSADNKTCTYNSTTYYIAQPYASDGKSKPGWNISNGIKLYADITLPTGSSFTLSSIAWVLDAQSTSFSPKIGVKGGLIDYTSSSLSVSNSTTATSGTLSSLNQSWVGGTTYRVYVDPSSTANSGKYFGIIRLTLTGDYTAPITGPSISSFSPATGATVKSGTTVTVEGSTGSTIYYLWASSAPANAAAVVENGTAGTTGAATVTTSGIDSENGTTLYAVAVKDATNSEVASASYTIDDAAPTLSSSNPANSATGVATSGTIVLTFSEDIASVDDSKFSLDGATIGTVVIDGTDATKVNVPYSGAGYESTVTLSTAANAVADAVGNKSAALSDIAFTTKAQTYSITFAAGGGSGSMAAIEDITSGSEQALTANTFTRDCYSFSHWTADVDVTVNNATVPSGNRIDDEATIQNITKDITLTAQWTELYANGKYTFDNTAKVGTNPSKTVSTTSTAYDAFRVDNLFFSGMTIQLEEGTNGDGDNYKGWKIKSNGTTKFIIDDDKKVTVGLGSIGSGSSAKIAYTNLAGEVQSDVSLSAATNNTYMAKSGTVVTISFTPASTKSIALKKIFIQSPHSITYALGTGASGTTPTETDKAEGEKFTLHNGTTGITAPSGKVFNGWNDGTSTYAGGATYTMPDNDVTLTAQWAQLYTVTFDANENGTCGTESLTEASAGAGVTLPDVTPNSGYAFNGWYDAASAGTKVGNAGDNYKPGSNTTVYAHYSLVYTVTYKSGTGTGDDVVDDEATTVAGCPNSFTAPTGKVFTGWKDNGNNDVAIGASVTSTLTLTAQWTTPTSGILFSAKVAATSKQSIAAGADGLELTASQATVTGGHMYVYNRQTSAKDLIAKSGSDYYFCETNNNTFFKISLNNALAAGDIITIDAIGGLKDDTDEKGIWVSTATSRPGSAPACSGTSTTTSLVEKMVNYTVTNSDEYVGKTDLYIYRAAGASTYFDNITISRPATVTITSAGWATYCSPYALDLEHATNLTDAYIVTGATGDALDMTSVKGGTVPANTGLLLKAPAGTVTIPVVASSSTDVSDNELVGVTLATVIEANTGYVLMGSPSLGFYKNANAFTLGANTAYLPANFATTNAPSAFRFVDEENNATNIENVEAAEKAIKFFENGQIYILRDGITYDALGRKVR